MAKVGKELQNKQQANLWFRHQVTIRKPSYKQDLEKLIKEDRNLRKEMEGIAQKYKNYNKNSLYNGLSKKRDEIISKFCEKYDIAYVFESDFIMPFTGNGIVELVHDKEDSAKEWFRKRWLNFSIDTFQDLDLIKDALSDYIRVINNTFRKAYGIKIPKGVHLRNAVRLIKVFDFRDRKPPLSFSMIALTLIKEGYYENKTLKQVTDLAKNDFRTIFEKIYEIPYKEYDKKEFKKSHFERCRKCSAYKECKEYCPELEYYLRQNIDVKRTEVLFHKGVTDIMPAEVLEKKHQHKKTAFYDDENAWREQSYQEGVNRNRG